MSSCNDHAVDTNNRTSNYQLTSSHQFVFFVQGEAQKIERLMEVSDLILPPAPPPEPRGEKREKRRKHTHANTHSRDRGRGGGGGGGEGGQLGRRLCI